jgi:hypothetical protein
MGAAIKQFGELEGRSAHTSGTEREAPVPDGFEIILSDGNKLKVRLRRSLHRGNPLGIAILHRPGSSPATIEQFDIVPKLSAERRKYAEQQLISAYRMCESPTSYSEGRRALERSVSEGLVASCQFGALGISRQ